uniref:Uncharacterized protein n=1 Tax=Metapenaeus joyneri majanivirus TaxID=2984280 RepID=A0A9C7BZN6_9VIRU|nr:MAG: hypothetical protein [Metapenaeus joyneri majanivirus]
MGDKKLKLALEDGWISNTLKIENSIGLIVYMINTCEGMKDIIGCIKHTIIFIDTYIPNLTYAIVTYSNFNDSVIKAPYTGKWSIKNLEDYLDNIKEIKDDKKTEKKEYAEEAFDCALIYVVERVIPAYRKACNQQEQQQQQLTERKKLPVLIFNITNDIHTKDIQKTNEEYNSKYKLFINEILHSQRKDACGLKELIKENNDVRFCVMKCPKNKNENNYNAYAQMCEYIIQIQNNDYCDSYTIDDACLQLIVFNNKEKQQQESSSKELQQLLLINNNSLYTRMMENMLTKAYTLFKK